MSFNNYQHFSNSFFYYSYFFSFFFALLSLIIVHQNASFCFSFNNDTFWVNSFYTVSWDKFLRLCDMMSWNLFFLNQSVVYLLFLAYNMQCFFSLIAFFCCFCFIYNGETLYKKWILMEEASRTTWEKIKKRKILVFSWNQEKKEKKWLVFFEILRWEKLYIIFIRIFIIY